MNSGYQGLKIACLLCISLLLSACLSDTSYAPVAHAEQRSIVQSGRYVVHKGDTLYSIAWTFGLDYRALAAANGLKPPYSIYPGQRLRMLAPPRRTHATAKPKAQRVLRTERIVKIYVAKQKTHVRNKQPISRARKVWANRPSPHWVWPARGRIAQGFSSNLAGNRGIDITGRLGEPIHAAASGIVVYSGDGIRGYGNLLIIKHNDSYLSAYAFNEKLLVKLGQRVGAGQTIAKMGRNNAGRVMLHFEIRRNGKPVNPKRYLRS